MSSLSFEAEFNDIGKYGQIATPFKMKDFNDIGIEFQDTVRVTFLDRELIVPFVPNYRYTHSGGTVLMAYNERANIDLLSFHSNFVKKNKIAVFLENDNREIDIMLCHGIKFPINFTFELDKKMGYHDEYVIYDLKRTNNRSDYPNLTDEEFCNFRNIVVGRIKPGILYRSSSPINPEIGRNKYADDCYRKYGIKTIINLCDSEEEAKKFENYENTYYSKQNIIFLNSNADITSYNFGKSIIKSIRFILSNPGPYAIHCIEGQDRTGAICAIIEAIMSASKNQLMNDFMLTYENYYGIEKNSERYMHIIKGELQDNVASLRGFDYGVIDVLKNPESYLLYLDLFEEELKNLKLLLGK